MPRFSIIMPCFNAADTIADTLDSLLAQEFADWEAICVDDGSTDATPEIIGAYHRRDPRIRRVGHAGKGPSAARNAGALVHADGELVAFCDADDLWTPSKLARLDRLFTLGNPDAVFGRVAFMDAGVDASMRRSTVPEGALSIEMLLGENPVCTMSNLTVTRRAFVASGGFDTGLVQNEDLEWLVRLVGTGGRIVGDHALHVFYRCSPTGLSSDLVKMQESRRAVLEAAARYGVATTSGAEAVYARYLARRALRLDAEPTLARDFALRGLRHNPKAFLFPLRRGAATAFAAMCLPLLPTSLRRALAAAR